jgi:hypothetical protein
VACSEANPVANVAHRHPPEHAHTGAPENLKRLNRKSVPFETRNFALAAGLFSGHYPVDNTADLLPEPDMAATFAG